MIIATATIFLVFLVFALAFTIIKLFDKTFLIGYPGCDDKLNELSEKGLIDDYSINWSWWRTKIIFIDFIENLIIWLETGLAAFSGLQLTVVLNYDLVVYWSHLHGRLLWLKEKFATIHEQSYFFIGRSHSDDHVYRSSPLGNLSSNQIYRQAYLKGASPSRGQSRFRIDCSDDSIPLLKHQLHDFFREIKRADSFISDTITLTLIIWLAIFCSYVYIVQYLNYDTNLGRRMIIIVPMIVLTLNYSVILALHRYCCKSYPVLCSIMALTPSLEDKKSVMAMLTYFNERRTCYRLFGQGPFLPSTYLSIVGWSFSCFFIIVSLAHHA